MPSNVWMLNLKQLLADQEMKMVPYSTSREQVVSLLGTVHRILKVLS